MSAKGGKRFRSELPVKPAEIISSSATLEGESPEDTDYVDSAGSDDSLSVLSQSLSKRRLVPSLKRENARQNFAESLQSSPDKSVSGKSFMFCFLTFPINIGSRYINITFFSRFFSQSSAFPT